MKTLARRILNLALWLNFSMMVATGLLLEFRLPPGSEGGHGLSVFNLTRHEWGDRHLLLGYIFLALILAHMALAWPWLKKVAAKGKILPVLGGLIIGILIMLSPFLIPVQGTGSNHDQHPEHAVDKRETLEPTQHHHGQGPRRGKGKGQGWGRRLEP
jgi:hypothetical protein